MTGHGANILLGIDVGGTFTDVVALDAGAGRIVGTFKLPSTPDDPSAGALAGAAQFLARSGLAAGAVHHGTTICTNALIEKRGARTALVTTEGFRDVLALRRQARPRLYDLAPEISPPLVPRARRLEVAARMAHDGETLLALSAAEIERIIGELRALEVEAVAISLLHAYADDSHERALETAIAEALPGVFVSRASDVTAEFREFERTSTVTVNAYIGPRAAT